MSAKAPFVAMALGLFAFRILLHQESEKAKEPSLPPPTPMDPLREPWKGGERWTTAGTMLVSNQLRTLSFDSTKMRPLQSGNGGVFGLKALAPGLSAFDRIESVLNLGEEMGKKPQVYTNESVTQVLVLENEAPLPAGKWILLVNLERLGPWNIEPQDETFGADEAAWDASNRQRIANQLTIQTIGSDSVARANGVRAFELRYGLPNDDPFLPPYLASAKVGEWILNGPFLEQRRVYTDAHVEALTFVKQGEYPGYPWVLLASTVDPGPWSQA